MDQPFAKIVKAAVGPGWLVWLLAVALLAANWFLFRQFMTTKPDWVLDLTGPEVGWEDVKRLWLVVMALWRMGIWAFGLLMIWLTLWSRKLNR